MIIGRIDRRAAAARRVGALAALVALALLAGCANLLGVTPIDSAAAGATTLHRIVVNGDRRAFLLHVPPHPARPAPLFFLLHGTSATANVVMDESGMNRIADSLGAIVVYPYGTGGIPFVRLFWNVAGCCERGSHPDEGAMIRAIADTLATRFPVDRSRIAVAGFSDAGTLAYEIACAEASVVTAIGVVSGELPRGVCTPSPAVSTVVFHGTADRNIPYGATREHVAEWARRLGCRSERSDTTAARVDDAYTGCADGASVVLHTIVGGAHAWPGGRRSWALAPRPSRSTDASRVLAAFVMARPRSVRR